MTGLLLLFFIIIIIIVVVVITINKSIKIIFVQHIKIVNLREHELRLIAKNRSIKNYKNISREKLISTLDELHRNFETISEEGLERIAKMQNLSQNGLNQITKKHNQSQDDLEQIAKMRRSRSYGKMSKEELIIDLLKSKRSIAELFNNNLDDDKIFNRLREILPKIIRKEIKKKDLR